MDRDLSGLMHLYVYFYHEKDPDKKAALEEAMRSHIRSRHMTYMYHYLEDTASF